MATKSLDERLEELYNRRDYVGQQFSAADVKTFVEGIRDAREKGGTPIKGATATELQPDETPTAEMTSDGTLVLGIPKGQKGDDGKQGDPGEQGKSAYQVWLEEGNEGTETDFLNSLKAHVAGFQSVAYDSNAPTTIGGTASAIDSFSPSADTMDKIVLMPNSGGTATIMYATTATESEGTTTYAFSCIGELAIDTSGFLSSSNVDGTELKNPTTTQVAKAADVMKLAAKLEGVTASEKKAANYPIAPGLIACRDYSTTIVTGQYRNTSSNTTKIAFVALGVSKAVRFLGLKVKNVNYIVGYVYLNIADIDTFISGLTDGDDLSAYIVGGVHPFEIESTQANNTEKFEILSSNPEGANYLALFYDTNQNSGYAVKDTNFYCYLMSGERVVDMIPTVVNSLTEGGSDKALSAEAGKELNEQLYGQRSEVETVVDIETNNFVRSLFTGEVTWKRSTSQYVDDRVAFGTVHGCKRVEIVTRNTTTEYARKVLFTKKALPTEQGDYTFDTLKDGGYLCGRYITASDVDNLVMGTTNIFDVPSDAIYVYVTKRRSSTMIITSLTVVSEVFVGGDINDLKSKVSGEEADDVPADLGTAMAVKKAYELINLPYRLRADLPTAFGGNYANVHAGDTPPSILYSSTRAMQAFVPNAISIETFLSAISDPNSVQYTETSGINEGWSKLYYGIVCGMFVEYCLGIKTMVNLNYSIFSTPGFELVETQDAQAMQIGYVLNDAHGSHAHCLICVGVRRKKGSGEVTKITLAESLYNEGNTPICQATDYTPTEFNALLASYHPTAQKAYTILKYTKLHKNTYDGSLVKKYIINKNLLPKKGNKAIYGVGENVVINLLDTTGYTHYKLWKDGELVDTVALENGSTINLGTLGYGKYKMVLTDNTNNSLPIEWIVVDYSVSCELVDDGQNDKVKIYFSSKNAEPLSAHWANGEGNGNGMLSVNFELTDEDIDNGYVITQLSQEPNCVNGLPRYTNSGSDYDVFHDAYAGGRKVLPRVIFVTEFGLFTSPTPNSNSGVLIYQS